MTVNKFRPVGNHAWQHAKREFAEVEEVTDYARKEYEPTRRQSEGLDVCRECTSFSSSDAFVGLETDGDHIKPGVRTNDLQLAQNASIRTDIGVSDVNDRSGTVQ
jgi:hypothetical protein